ncbi:hypothetical protein [Leptospira noguchii]|uniref:Uncharacterized protein n=1 Tax=Leptospira noguchii TaxID=28182 RepID=A0AAE9K8U8_9LEPT|nr:hypothetical protein [Leptospira noguchii]UOG52300.1 hypothetical protein MAL09_17155 [Leptospira noguchii]UOG56279.1 hypothetical protein MAL03_15930 [Leptospira noguchii]
MLRSVESSIEFEKFRRNWSEKNSAQRFPMGRVNSASRFYWRSGNSKRCCLLSQR